MLCASLLEIILTAQSFLEQETETSEKPKMENIAKTLLNYQECLKIFVVLIAIYRKPISSVSCQSLSLPHFLVEECSCVEDYFL